MINDDDDDDDDDSGGSLGDTGDIIICAKAA